MDIVHSHKVSLPLNCLLTTYSAFPAQSMKLCFFQGNILDYGLKASISGMRDFILLAGYDPVNEQVLPLLLEETIIFQIMTEF